MAREIPVLMSSPMARACLAGAKTQTRRIIRTVAGVGGLPLVRLPRTNYAIRLTDAGLMWTPFGGSPLVPWPADRIGEVCPYGGPGDVLWVRETFAYTSCERDEPGAIPVTAHPRMHFEFGNPTHFRVRYLADLEEIDWEPPTCRPSIHMPRWAARIFLRVEAVRVEFLNAITLADVRAEGFPDAPNIMPRGLDAFAGLWDSLNGHKPGARWASNPLCWVVTFRRVAA